MLAGILMAFLYAVLCFILISDLALLMSVVPIISNNNTNSVDISSGTYTFNLDRGWNNQIILNDYKLEEFCTNLRYTSKLYDNDNILVAYADTNTIFNGDNKRIYTVSERNTTTLKGCFIITSMDNVVVTVNCYLLGGKYDFIYNDELVATANLINASWILTTYTNVDLRLYGIFISKLLFISYNTDGCNYYFVYTCALMFIVIFTHCFICICVQWNNHRHKKCMPVSLLDDVDA